MSKKRYKCPKCMGFVAEANAGVEIVAYCKKCREFVQGVEFKEKRPRISKENLT